MAPRASVTVILLVYALAHITTTHGYTNPNLPSGWRIISQCVIKNAASTFGTVWSWSQNTPANCANYCAGDSYTYAGVANGHECICGNSYNPALATPASTINECSTPCLGDSAQSCGGQDRVEVFTSVPVHPPPLPRGWLLLSACAVDSNDRILVSPTISQLSNNSPYNCATHCAEGSYLYAGVEYGNECYCSNNIKSSYQQAPDYECNMPCSGDNTQLCGAGWRIQIYRSPALGPGYFTLSGCAVDTPSSPALTTDVFYKTPSNNVDLPNQCTKICHDAGFPKAGPVNGTTCECGQNLASNIHFVDQSECNLLCPEPPGIPGQVYCGGYNRILVYQYTYTS